MDSNVTTYCISGQAFGATGGFVLSATPCGDANAGCPAAANNAFLDPYCDVLTIDNAGNKTAGGTLATVDQCWQR